MNSLCAESHKLAFIFFVKNPLCFGADQREAQTEHSFTRHGVYFYLLLSIKVSPFPCGIMPFGPGSLWFYITQRGLILKIWKNYVIHLNCLSFISIFRCFIKKSYFIPVIHGFLGPTQKSWAIWPNVALWAIFKKCGNNLQKKIRWCPVASIY